ncbi:ComF family protein [Embleya sp. NPDC050154]|uniref:ComF family protein n=2 Tax=unclassified Embleya TaxID=2699296 RepID=UPI0037B0E16A
MERRRVFATWADLVLPVRCAGCAEPGALLCAECHGVFAPEPAPARPTPAPEGLPPVHAITGYEGPVRSVLAAYKEHGAHSLARPLGDALARAAAAGLSDPVGPCLLVPVPSTRAAVRRRGRDAIGELALRAAGRLRAGGTRTRVLPALRHTRRVRDQAGLSARERGMNVHRSMIVSDRLAPLFTGISVVIVVDDVCTTGATLAEATRAVRAVGGRVEAAAVLAATARRRRPEQGHRRPGRSVGCPPLRHGAMDGVLRGHCRQGPQDRGTRAFSQALRREAGEDPEARRQGDQR